ncbi:unnamed protein product [Didymodactylos carnosus]|uniref:Poly [ADP-ribose] polymerase n=1 Tax=Didymodactylos carnosus TaxID=1234261 RepID=A0A8S2DRL4_9BILA|nr:unnamed protein product [Didymodactylos carnosus]CAF3805203.1 unnamed protein product [Didymodactylos carnosus]
MDPTTSLTVIYQVVIVIKQTVHEVKANQEQCQRLGGRIDAITSVLESLNDQDLQRQELQKSLSNFHSCVNQCLEFVKKFADKTSWFDQIFKNQNYKKQFEELNLQLSQCATDLNLGVNLKQIFDPKLDESDQRKDLNAIQSKIDDIASMMAEMQSEQLRHYNRLENTITERFNSFKHKLEQSILKISDPVRGARIAEEEHAFLHIPYHDLIQEKRLGQGGFSDVYRGKWLDIMVLSKPSDFVATNGDASVFLQWSPVLNATQYEIQIKAEDTWAKNIHYTTATSFIGTDLKNGTHYLAQVIAINAVRQSEPSITLKIRPKVGQSLFNLSIKRGQQQGQMSLKFRAVPTDLGYKIERCDVADMSVYICVATIKDKNTVSYEDKTNCDPLQHSCLGHYYTMSIPDAIWWPGTGVLSRKVFCIRTASARSGTVPQTTPLLKHNSSEASAASNLHMDPWGNLPPNPEGNLPTDPWGNLPTNPEGNLSTDPWGNLPTDPWGNLPTDPWANLPTNPWGNLPTNRSPQQLTQSATGANSKQLMYVRKGDLTTEQTDVIVVCSSSQVLLENIFRASGDTVKTAYNIESKQKSPTVIVVAAGGQLAAKKIYFLPWQPNSDAALLCESLKKFVSNAIEKAVTDNYKSIAFPAIDRTDIYDEFQKQIDSLQQPQQPPEMIAVSATIGNGMITVEKGDITTQKVDVIIGSLSSEILKQSIIKAAGIEVKTAYETESKNNPNSILISTLPSQLPCKRIFFLKWQPDANDAIFRQSIVDFIWNVMQNVISYNYTSIAFPAIGCGKHGCSVDIVVKTMVKEIKNQLKIRNLSLTVKFVIEPEQQNVYDEFCTQVLGSEEAASEKSVVDQLPSLWERSTENKIRFVVSNITDEYKSIVTDFDQTMKGKYRQIIQVERIQNERWYMQYLAHSQDFKKRLNTDTEKRLYHGCPQEAAHLIMEDCFNRSFAGVNGKSFSCVLAISIVVTSLSGTVYGFGVYFSSNAAYSHNYTLPNSNGERCMFVSRVLIGKTTKGNSSMKTRPVGFDSTTDGNHIFVTYHDAQAVAEYLITYK